MLRTALCERLGIEAPVFQGPIGPATWPQLAAAVSNAGGLGSLAGILRGAEQLNEMIRRTRELLTAGQPFAVNFVINTFDEEAFAAALESRPAVVSFALGDPGELVSRAQDAGAIVMAQVVTVEAAYRAAERGADVILAQG